MMNNNSVWPSNTYTNYPAAYAEGDPHSAVGFLLAHIFGEHTAKCKKSNHTTCDDISIFIAGLIGRISYGHMGLTNPSVTMSPWISTGQSTHTYIPNSCTGTAGGGGWSGGGSGGDSNGTNNISNNVG